jgi:hypothetical protein
MHLYEIISSHRSSAWHALQNFKNVISRNDIWRPIDDIQFVFLCGANIDKDTPSQRRKILLDFASKNLPYAKLFLAESIFKIIDAEGGKSNLLDIENDLSDFADYVVLILESESTFCELGAFSVNNKLRKKLVVINDSQHIGKPSFINLGPIKAIQEMSSGNNILPYKMDIDGKIHGDGIGDIFHKLHALIHKEPAKRRTRVKEFNPNQHFTKDSIRFIHDLIYFMGPIYQAELSRVIKILFHPEKEKQLLKHLGMLSATDQINHSRKNLYYSVFNKPFFEYESYDTHKLIASFKNLYFRYDKSRLLWK